MERYSWKPACFSGIRSPSALPGPGIHYALAHALGGALHRPPGRRAGAPVTGGPVFTDAEAPARPVGKILGRFMEYE